MTVTLIQWCLEHLNYWTVAFFMAIESSFIPFPSEVVVPPAAYRAAAGDLNVYWVVVFATLGANLGGLVNYAIAYYLGRPVIYAFVNTRIGRMCLLDDKKVEKAEKFFNNHGAVATFTGRLVPAVRQLISIPAGLARMNVGKFLLYTTLGAGIWNSVLAGLGYYLYSVVPEDQLIAQVTIYSREIGWTIILIVCFILGFLCYKGWKK